MDTQTFHPRETERFLFCCGGYRRWELVEAGGAWWWELASDWGQAHVADLVVPPSARITARVDVSRPTAAHGSVELASRVRVGRTGIDGLPFAFQRHLAVRLERGRLRLEGEDLAEPLVQPLAEQYWEKGAVMLEVERTAGHVHIFIEGDQVAEASTLRDGPALVMLTANSAGAPEAGTRFGPVEVTRR